MYQTHGQPFYLFNNKRLQNKAYVSLKLYLLKLKTCLVLFTILLAGALIFERNKPAHYYEIEEPKTMMLMAAEPDYFEEAVKIIKEYEGWHSKQHYPYVGYGHKVLKGEKLDHTISEEVATELVRKDLKQKCAVFREYGNDSLLLGVLAYNVGEYKLMHTNGSPKSSLLKKLKEGNRDVYADYVSYKKAGGRTIPNIERRRIKEFQTLFIK